MLNNNCMKDISNPKRIQGTNDNSILSKCSMIKYDYFDDEFLPYMISKFSRRAPLINRGYYIRAKAINQVLTKFLETYGDINTQIISLGAGFDTSFFRLHSKNLLSKCLFVEVDYLSVSSKKASLMKQENKLWNCLDNFANLSINKDQYIVIDATNYKLLGCDMTQLDVLDACFNQVGVSNEIPTLFLSECVITYIGVKKTRKLLNFFSKYFNQNTFVLYEQIYPDDSFGKFMCSHFKNLGSSLRGIGTYKTKQSQIQRFFDAGWDSVQICDMCSFYYEILSSEERRRIEIIEVFDELEEWILKCCHYFVLVAKKQNLDWDPGLGPNHYHDSEVLYQETNVGLELCRELMPLNHESDAKIKQGGIKCHYNRLGLITVDQVDYVVRISGYGQNPDAPGHCKLSSISIYNSVTNKVVHVTPQNYELILESLCGTVTQISNNQFLLFGGRSSPLKPNNSLLLLTLDYDSIHETWTGHCKEVLSQQNKPGVRWRHSAAYYRVKNERFLLVHGGKSECISTQTLSDTYIFNINNESWNKIIDIDGGGGNTKISPGPLQNNVAISLAPSFDNNNQSNCHNNNVCCGCCDILFFGGSKSTIEMPSNEFWRWCGYKKEWTMLTNKTPTNFIGKISLTGHVIRKSNVSMETNCCQGDEIQEIVILLVGGAGYVSDHSCHGDVLSLVTIDMVTNEITNIENVIVNNNDLNRFELLYNHGSVWLSRQQRLIVIGGGGNCFSFGTQLNNDVYYIDLSQK